MKPTPTPSDPLGPPRFPSQEGGSGENGVPADGDGIRKKCWSMEKNIEFDAPQARQSVPEARSVLGWSQGCVEWLMSLILDKFIRGRDPLDPLGPPLRGGREGGLAKKVSRGVGFGSQTGWSPYALAVHLGLDKGLAVISQAGSLHPESDVTHVPRAEPVCCS